MALNPLYPDLSYENPSLGQILNRLSGSSMSAPALVPFNEIAPDAYNRGARPPMRLDDPSFPRTPYVPQVENPLPGMAPPNTNDPYQMLIDALSRANQEEMAAYSQPLPQPPSGVARPGQMGLGALLALAGNALDPNRRLGADFAQGMIGQVQYQQKAKYSAALNQRELDIEKARIRGRGYRDVAEVGFKREMSKAEQAAMKAKMDFEAEQNALDRKSRLDVASARVSGQTKAKLMDQAFKAQSPDLRWTAYQALMEFYPEEFQAVSEEEFKQFTPKEQKDLAATENIQAKTLTENQSRQYKVENLIKQGRNLDAKVEATKAMTELNRVRAQWLPKNVASQIRTREMNAQTALQRANNSLYLGIQRLDGMDAKTQSKVLADVDKAIQEVDSLGTYYAMEIDMLNKKIAAETDEKRKAQLQDALDKSQTAWLWHMDKLGKLSEQKENIQNAQVKERPKAPGLPAQG